VNDLFAHCATATEYPHAAIPAPERPGEVRHSVVDPSRARRVLGWEPWTSVPEGIAATVAWAASSGAA